MYDRVLRLTKNILGIVALFYFFAPILARYIIKKKPGVESSSVIDFFNMSIFHPINHQYDIALGKNSAIYWLAFYVCMLLACFFCWLIAFYVMKIIYLLIKKVAGK